LNCNTEVQGRFCHICGQENVEPKETVWGLVSHFFHDITHFDGKFFTSLKWLVVKPGFLSKEYIMGRRARHLNPIRMYVFTASLFFILFFSFFFDIKNLKVGTSNRQKDKKGNVLVSEKIKENALSNAETKEDSANIEKGYRYINKFADTGITLKQTEEPHVDSLNKTGIPTKSDNSEDQKGKNNTNFNLFFNTSEYRSEAHYDSVQHSLSPEFKDGWLKRAMKRKEIHLNQKIKEEGSTKVFTQLLDKFMHSFPQILFLSLPLIALVLQLLYIRRKQFYYVNHGIFLIHIYIYSFINLLVFFSLGKLGDTLGWSWMPWIQFTLWLHALWYVYKAMRNFYGQRRFKTIVKFFLLNTFTTAIITFLFVIFFLFSAWNL
jgi:hypothetical protein